MIEVRDVVLWLRHIHGSPALRESLLELGPEEIVHLALNGRKTTWCRMKNGKDGRPTPGLRPCDEPTRALWNDLYENRRGELVAIEKA